jgi:7,8-dihydro-6-hydroxymethylpterin dimethyltransferase
VIPVPCHPDCLAMAYALKLDGNVLPLTGLIDPKVLLHGEGNTIVYERHPQLRSELFKLFSTAASPQGAQVSLRQLLCCLPQAAAPSNVTYDNIFRIIIMQFLDAWNFDVRSVKKTCVHIAHPDGRIIPFDTYNLFYRPGLESRLGELQAMQKRMSEPLVALNVVRGA